MELRIAALHRYPVKGLSPEPLARAMFEKGAYFPGDRLFAIENGPSGFDPAEPQHQPKVKFLMLMRNESLARLSTCYEDDTGVLSVRHDGREVARGDLSTRAGRLAIEAFFRTYMPRELRGPPKVLGAPDGFRFTDSRKGFVSLINLASVRALEDMVGAPVDPLRFRGNLHVEGLEPWAELDIVGCMLENAAGLAAQGDEADRALRRDQCRPGDRHSRPRDPSDADAPARPCRLRRLCGSGGRGGACGG